MSTETPAAFVPLANSVSAKAQPDNFRLLVVPSPEKLRKVSEVSASVAPNPQPCNNADPRITLQKEDGKIVGIKVHCSCGQIIDLRCSYPEPG